jgi:hypothetical protein
MSSAKNNSRSKRRKIIISVTTAGVLGLITWAIAFYQTMDTQQLEIPSSNALSKTYDLKYNELLDNDSADVLNETRWRLAYDLFVKDIPQFSRPDTVHKKLGKPEEIVKSNVGVAALVVEDAMGVGTDTSERPRAKKYPSKFKWDDKVLTPSHVKEIADIYGEVYKVKYRFNGGKVLFSYWHIYYVDNRATYQSYSMSVFSNDWAEEAKFHPYAKYDLFD